MERVARALAVQEEETRSKSMAENTAFDQHFLLPGGAASTGSTTSGANSEAKTGVNVITHHRRDAIDIIGDYLPDEWVQLLYTAFEYVSRLQWRRQACLSSIPVM